MLPAVSDGLSCAAGGLRGRRHDSFSNSEHVRVGRALAASSKCRAVRCVSWFAVADTGGRQLTALRLLLHLLEAAVFGPPLGPERDHGVKMPELRGGRRWRLTPFLH